MMEREYVELPGSAPTPDPVPDPTPEPTPDPAAAAPVEGGEPAKPVEGEEGGEGGEHKRKTGSQRARERADRLEREAAELRARLAALEAPPKPAATGEPQLADFDTVEDYSRALREHVAKVAAKETEDRIRAEAANREAQQRQMAWKDADRKFAEKQPDFDDVMEDLRDVITEVAPKNPTTFAAIDSAVSESNLAPQLKYYLGKNPSELQKINAMSPLDAIKAIGRLEDKLANEKPPEKKTTQAPAPINPLPGTGSGSVKTARYDSYVELR